MLAILLYIAAALLVLHIVGFLLFAPTGTFATQPSLVEMIASAIRKARKRRREYREWKRKLPKPIKPTYRRTDDGY
jgi:hypothetical protein